MGVCVRPEVGRAAPDGGLSTSYAADHGPARAGRCGPLQLPRRAGGWWSGLPQSPDSPASPPFAAVTFARVLSPDGDALSSVYDALNSVYNDKDGSCLLRRCKCETLQAAVAKLPSTTARELARWTGRELGPAELAALRQRLPALLDRSTPAGNCDIDQRVGLRGWTTGAAPSPGRRAGRRAATPSPPASPRPFAGAGAAPAEAEAKAAAVEEAAAVAVEAAADAAELAAPGQTTASGSRMYAHFLAGAVAGAVSRTATAPLETLRVRMQVAGRCAMLPATAAAAPGTAAAAAGTAAAAAAAAAAASGPFALFAPGRISHLMVQEARAILREGGARGLYRGNWANVLRATPQKALDFYGFELFKRALTSLGAGSAGVLAAGAMAGVTSASILYPLDLVRSRMALDSVGRYRGVADALRQVATTEGPRALYRGAGASMAAIIPEAAIAYGLFDLLKSTYRQATHSEPGVAQSLAFGVASAFTGQAIAYPIETIARRLQVQSAGVAGRGLLDAMSIIIRTEGVAALYAGIVPASLRVIPMAMVSFSTYELARRAILQAADRLEQAGGAAGLMAGLMALRGRRSGGGAGPGTAAGLASLTLARRAHLAARPQRTRRPQRPRGAGLAVALSGPRLPL